MRIAVIAVVLLAGCVTTPNEIIESGTKTTHALKTPADRAPQCLANAIENHRAAFVASVRGNEVVVRGAGTARVVFVVNVEPAAQGSRATVWYSGFFLGGEDARAAMLAGC